LSQIISTNNDNKKRKRSNIEKSSSSSSSFSSSSSSTTSSSSSRPVDNPTPFPSFLWMRHIVTAENVGDQPDSLLSLRASCRFFAEKVVTPPHCKLLFDNSRRKVRVTVIPLPPLLHSNNNDDDDDDDDDEEEEKEHPLFWLRALQHKKETDS